MKYSIIFIFTLLILCKSSRQQTIKNDWGNLGLSGKIKSLQETIYLANQNFGNLEKGEIENLVRYTFNENGNITEKNIYQANGKLFMREKYGYSNKLLITGNRDMIGITNTICKYNEKGLLLEESGYLEYNGTIIKENKFNYDANQRLVEKDFYDYVTGNIRLIQKIFYKYDVRNNLTEIVLFDPNGRGSSKEPKYEFKIDYKYDKVGNKIEEVNEGVNADGNSGTDFKRITYTYDSDRRLLEKKLYSSSQMNVTETYSYVLDKNGNWIKKNKATVGKDWENQARVVERLIEYY